MDLFSPAAERNKQPILEYLAQWVSAGETVLEIGSYSGQHALFFTEELVNINWQCSDQKKYIQSLRDNIQSKTSSCLLSPIELDVMDYDWGCEEYDVVFTANTLHIMTDERVQYFINNVSRALTSNGKLIVYGPFSYNDQYTSDSNRAFDKQLQKLGNGSCIKAFEKINTLLNQQGFSLKQDVAMPANNQLIMWQMT